jgi:hypothetical protein
MTKRAGVETLSNEQPHDVINSYSDEGILPHLFFLEKEDSHPVIGSEICRSLSSNEGRGIEDLVGKAGDYSGSAFGITATEIAALDLF